MIVEFEFDFQNEDKQELRLHFNNLLYFTKHNDLDITEGVWKIVVDNVPSELEEELVQFLKTRVEYLQNKKLQQKWFEVLNAYSS